MQTEKNKYEVIACCDHYGCNYNESHHITYAISMKAARDSADQLNIAQDKYCPNCKRKMGFFPK
jgi:hypothetical protein